MNDIVLETRDLCKAYRHTAVLDHVNIQIRRGQIVGFIGQNGAGKTTLLRMVAVGCGILAMNALPWFFAVVFGDFGRALAVSLLCYGVLVFLMNGDSPARGYPLSRLLPMGQLRLLAMDALPISCGAMIASDILWACVLVVVAWLIFRRRDFK